MNYKNYVDLIDKAETDMLAKGRTSLDDRLYMLSGIYYATTWCHEYLKIHNDFRRVMFERCLDKSYTALDDPRPIFRATLYSSLERNQDISDSEPVDMGHLLIGLSARLKPESRDQIIDISRLAGAIPIGVFSTHCTGLEIVTWAGDLGGGAARLALDRADAAAKAKPGAKPPTIPASKYFSGTDYGAPSNLYGDVYAYAVAAGTTGKLDRPSIGPPLAHPVGIADAFKMFFVTATKGAKPSLKSDACKTFLQALGGTYGTGGRGVVTTLTNQATVESLMADKIEGFGYFYMYNHLASVVVKTPPPPPPPKIPKGGGILDEMKAVSDAIKSGVSAAGAAASAGAKVLSLHSAALPFLRPAAEEVAKLFMKKLLANNLR